VQAKVDQLIAGTREEQRRIEQQGGMVAALESGYIKRELVRSHTERLRAIERGDLKVVGVNCYAATEPSPLTECGDASILKVDPAAERQQVERLRAHRERRNAQQVKTALAALGDAARGGANVMPASVQCAKAAVTTGEWADVLRGIFGEYRPTSGIDIVTQDEGDAETVESLRHLVRETSEALGRPLKLLIGKPGLDGHSSGAEQIAVKARDIGCEVVYEGIRLSPEQIATAAQEEGVHVVGLSVLSGSHLELVSDVMDRLAAAGLGAVPVLVGGIIPSEDAAALREKGVAGVYTPKDSDLNTIMQEMVSAVRRGHDMPPARG